MKRATPASRLFSYCVQCGESLEGLHWRAKYCSDACKRKYRNVSEGNYPPPEYVGDYDLMPDHIKALFVPGDPRECWISNKRGPNGYAHNTTVNMYKSQAYRLVYMMMVGPIPPGLDLDHTCDNGAGGCINWHHLKPATRRWNTIRTTRTLAGQEVRKTHCPKGHPYSGDNLILTKRKDGIDRECRTCKRERLNRWRRENRERALELQRQYEQSPKGRATRAAKLERYRQQRLAKKQEAS